MPDKNEHKPLVGEMFKRFKEDLNNELLRRSTAVITHAVQTALIAIDGIFEEIEKNKSAMNNDAIKSIAQINQTALEKLRDMLKRLPDELKELDPKMSSRKRDQTDVKASIAQIKAELQHISAFIPDSVKQNSYDDTSLENRINIFTNIIHTALEKIPTFEQLLTRDSVQRRTTSVPEPTKPQNNTPAPHSHL